MDEFVGNLLREHNLWYEYGTTGNPNEVYIFVECGDWKHDHLYLQHLMKENGFTILDKRAEPSDDDCYTAEYTFAKL